MVAELDNFRKKYPDYNDLSDSDLAGMLAKKYPDSYSDLPSLVEQEQPKSSGVTGSWEEPITIGRDPRAGLVSGERPPMGAITTTKSELKGVGESVVKTGIEGGAMVLGEAVGGPAGAGVFYAGGKRIGEAVFGEESDPSLLEFGKDVATGALISGAAKFVNQQITPVAEKLSKVIKNGIEKAIRPSVVGKGSSAPIESYFKNAEEAVVSILRRDRFAKNLPKTLDEFSEQVYKTKMSVWDELSSMSSSATEQGIKVDLNPVIKEMRDIGNSSLLKRASPEESKRLLNLANDWASEPTIVSPSEAEKLLGMVNTNAKAWWKDRNPNSVHSALNWERTAENIRAALKKSIPDGDKYLALRREYGSLLSIEKDVAHRAIVSGRRNPKGFFDIADIGGTAHFIHGLVNMNPGTIAAGAATKGLVKYTKWMNNPDRIVKGMFSEADKLLSKLPPKERAIVLEAIKPVKQEPYRYNPEFKGAKSPPIKKLSTDIQPGEPPIEVPQKEKLFPDQLYTVREGKVALSRAKDAETGVGRPLLKPKEGVVKSPPVKPLSVEKKPIEPPQHIVDLMEKARRSKSPNIKKTLRKRAVEEFNKIRKRNGLDPVDINTVEGAVKAKQELTKKQINEFRKKKGLPLF